MTAVKMRRRERGAGRTLLQVGIAPAMRETAGERAAKLGISISMYIEMLIKEDQEGGIVTLPPDPPTTEEALIA